MIAYLFFASYSWKTPKKLPRCLPTASTMKPVGKSYIWIQISMKKSWTFTGSTPCGMTSINNIALSEDQGPSLATHNRSSLWKNWKRNMHGSSYLVLIFIVGFHTSANSFFIALVFMFFSVKKRPIRHLLYLFTSSSIPSSKTKSSFSSSSIDRFANYSSIGLYRAIRSHKFEESEDI